MTKRAEELVAAIRKARAAKATFAEIGELINATAEAVRLWHNGKEPSERMILRAKAWLDAGAPVPPRKPRSSANALPLRAELLAALHEAGNYTALAERGFKGVHSRKVIIKWCKTLDIPPPRRRHRKEPRVTPTYIKRLRALHDKAVYVSDAHVTSAVLLGHATPDRRLTRAGVLLALRPADVRWLLHENRTVAMGPNDVSESRLHPACARWLAHHEIIDLRNNAQLTTYGVSLVEQLRKERVPPPKAKQAISSRLRELGWDVG